MPIITLYFQDNNISLSQIFLLQSIYSFAVFIFEVPTGYFGDKIARKSSMGIGLGLFTL
jgi:MFS family permease